MNRVRARRDNTTMTLLRCLGVSAFVALLAPLAAQDLGFIGREACGQCHPAQSQAQSTTGHARALRRARPSDPGPGNSAEWAFGAGAKATTWVSQTSGEVIAEHGLTFYASTKSLGLTPGHSDSKDHFFRMFDPVATALLCFRCHSTGPVTLSDSLRVQPTEPGVHCESCHGPGRIHAQSGGAKPIQNPKKLTAGQINTLCGSCHRQVREIDNDEDWSNAWNVRHQPPYLDRAACFRNSGGAVSCLTCHDLHQPLSTASASYDAQCISCHMKPAHPAPVASGTCVGCHMPQVTVSPNLEFTNHWIGVYDALGKKLIPSKRIVKALQPATTSETADRIILPAHPSTLTPVYAKALAEKERRSGPESADVARAASDLGLFLLKNEDSAAAVRPLRRALSIDERNRDVAVDADRENLALVLETQGKLGEALELFGRAAEGADAGVASRAFAKLAELDPERADIHYEKAIAAEEKASGRATSQLAMLLQQYAQALRDRQLHREAEPPLRRALAIQRATPKANARVTIGLLNSLGHLLEGLRRFDEAEILAREALALAEQKYGPESVELARTCTLLADILWNKKRLQEAGLLFRRAILINASLYGPDQPETAADIANLGMLTNEAGQKEMGGALLRQALEIFENALGPESEEARFVRERIETSGR